MAGIVTFPKTAAPAIENVDLSEMLEVSAPSEVSESAFHGVAGRIVNRIIPHTEASKSALLASFLVGVGNLIGGGPYFMADGARHRTNLFVALVGDSSRGRKGTSWVHTFAQLKVADESWASNCITNGLSSGEGLIWAVRDPVKTNQQIKEKGRVVGTEEVVTDNGVSDKRLFVMEGELSQCLRVMQREGSTLSVVIRNAWDGIPKLQIMTKSSPGVATGAHISTLAHITREELRSQLSQSDTSNGFANRFVWVCVNRSKLLPDGGEIWKEDFSSDQVELARAVDAARRTGEVKRDKDAGKLWHQIYPVLSEARPGLFGAVTSRAEAQVVRFSLIYALLDGNNIIKREHLEAALAFWKYCEESARFIFQSASANGDANRIIEAMRANPSVGMTKTQINRSVFNGNFDSARIDEALSYLQRHHLIRPHRESTGGRAKEVWFIEARVKA